ncbi:Kynurenine 3-monooxygenase [Araneus ventricosus]|uniref:Kynurenine 3-monooxygenase n=1 Tax=Araneus ventricosus TaxID=182803 RepID=A0A4Y2IHG7_ARAVE|nr:Kynurenine 3-monooxygenase [Araneus ventricosus]
MSCFKATRGLFWDVLCNFVPRSDDEDDTRGGTQTPRDLSKGFEDCEILSELLCTYNYDLKKVLPEYTRRRQKDAEIICDSARATFNVMKLHTSKKFLLRSQLDNLLNKMFPRSWIVLNTEVTFSKTPYSQCFARKQKQDKILSTMVWSAVIVGFCFAVSIFARL